MSEDEHIDMLLVDRMREVYWPGWIRELTEARVRGVVPRVEYVAEQQRHRDNVYDLGRVHHFLLEIEAGRTLEPILIDTRWYGNVPGPPVITDGHHRFQAAVLARKRRIPASIGGMVSTIEWLTGKRRRDRRPREIDG